MHSLSLEDKYRQTQGDVFLSATQALVRLALDQRRRDVAAGLSTGGFISGYRGSPVGGVDHALWQAEKHLAEYDVKFVPGVNEELAATACWGTQQLGILDPGRVDGVFALWYGKGPGVDRAGDVFKHANLAGTTPKGGVVAIAGDDHGAKSSTNAHQSDQALIAAMVPTFAPSDVQDLLDFGLYAIAASRYAGCWTALKLVSQIAESSARISVDPERTRIVHPEAFPFPQGGVHIRWPDDKIVQEGRLVDTKLGAVQAFVRANRLDRIVLDAPRRRLGIVAAGKAFADLRQILLELGIDQDQASALGLAVYKPALTWPIEPEAMLEFTTGLEAILVIEEKRGVIEPQIKELLFDRPPDRRPQVLGKRDHHGAPLVPSYGEISPELIGPIVARFLDDQAAGNGVIGDRGQAWLHTIASTGGPPAGDAAQVIRKEFFCSGCPHNTSTRVPEGSVAIAGIGCHTMASRMPDRRTVTLTQMGGEGATWIGQGPFSTRPHVFQNMGDGTFYHSGLLAIRAAISAGSNITYKILYNDAVAMTGGQPVEGRLTVPQIARLLQAEGVAAITVVSDDTEKYRGALQLPAEVTVRHRDDMDLVQREMREIQGTSILLYDQTCAAEKRRRRRRGRLPDPPRRVFINELVCEGCGDCGAASSCVSVVPTETAFGRKRRIDQSSCNKDYSCLKGFCPSFVTVEAASIRRSATGDLTGIDPEELPAPATVATDEPYSIMITGIGGTGVVTIGALIGTAAHIEGKAATIMDVTGLAQKNGAVTSHVRVAPSPDRIGAVKIGTAGTDLLLACDMVVAAGPACRETLSVDRSRAVINDRLVPTAQMNFDPDSDMDAAPLRDDLRRALPDDGSDFVDATGAATRLLGDAILGNVLLLGFAAQRGLLPVGPESLAGAIRLNGVAVDKNLAAFELGRYAAHDDAGFRALSDGGDRPPPPVTLDALMDEHAAFLTGYQNTSYAERYRARVARIAEAEAGAGLAADEPHLALAFARSYFKLLAYKDEYEVARLYTDSAFANRLADQFDGVRRLKFHLAPPLFARRDPVTGVPRKMTFGGWLFPALKLLARMKFLRGTPFDPFGRTAERQAERALIVEFEETMDTVLAKLSAETYGGAIELARLPQRIRGFGHVKAKAIDDARQQRAALLKALETPEARAHAA